MSSSRISSDGGQVALARGAIGGATACGDAQITVMVFVILEKYQKISE